MDGCKSNFKDCLPQAKRECEILKEANREKLKKKFKMKEWEEEKRSRKITDSKKKEELL